MELKIYTEEEKTELKELTKKTMNIPIAEIADNFYGLTLYLSKKEGCLKCYEHPSLTLDLKDNVAYYGNDKANYMSVYDFVSDYEQISKLEARNKLNEYYLVRDIRRVTSYAIDEETNQIIKHKGLVLPHNFANEIGYEGVREFLSQFSVNKEFSDKLIMNSILYVDEDNELVLVSYEDSFPIYAIKQSMTNLEDSKLCIGSYDKTGLMFINRDRKKLVTVNNILDSIALFSFSKEYNVIFIDDSQCRDDVLKHIAEKYSWFNTQEIVDFDLERILKEEGLENDNSSLDTVTLSQAIRNHILDEDDCIVEETKVNENIANEEEPNALLV